MKRLPYDIAMTDQVLQAIDSTAELSSKYVRERTGDFSDSRLSGKLGSLAANQLNLLPANLSKVSLDEASTATLYEVPKLGLGRQESRAGVQFGQLVVERPHDDVATELVAVKYLPPHLAAREFAATNVVRSRLGVTAAYEPIGFIADAKRRVGSISRYRHEVVTLDRVMWNEAATREQRLAGMAFAGTWLATLHDSGIAHGDAQAKNVAHDSANNPVMIDLETARELDDDRDASKRSMLSDIGDYLRYQPTQPTNEEYMAFVGSYLATHSMNLMTQADILENREQPLQPVYRFTPQT
jgi:hypothetical protein